MFLFFMFVETGIIVYLRQIFQAITQVEQYVVCKNVYSSLIYGISKVVVRM